MLCEFSKSELIDLDFSVMDRTIKAIEILRSQPHNKSLVEKIEQLEKLHKKINELLEQAEKEG